MQLYVDTVMPISPLVTQQTLPIHKQLHYTASTALVQERVQLYLSLTAAVAGSAPARIFDRHRVLRECQPANPTRLSSSLALLPQTLSPKARKASITQRKGKVRMLRDYQANPPRIHWGRRQRAKERRDKWTRAWDQHLTNLESVIDRCTRLRPDCCFCCF